MKNFILIFALIINANFVFGQAISYRYIKPIKGHGQDLRKGLEDKTKKYNSKENDPRIYTFAVRASQRGSMSGVLRMSYGETLGELSVGGSGQPGMMEYWMENVDKYIESNSPSEIFTLRKSATHNDALGTEKPFRRVFHYIIKPGQWDKFWKVRDNLPKAIEESGVDFDVNAFQSFAGGPRGHVRIVVFGKDMKSFEPGSGDWQKIRSAYEKIYGEDSWDIDWELSRNSQREWGNSVELLEFMPELSSPLLDK